MNRSVILATGLLGMALVHGCKTDSSFQESDGATLKQAASGACAGTHCVADSEGRAVNRNAECTSLSGDHQQGKNCPASYYPSKWDTSEMGPGFFHCDGVYQKGLPTTGPREAEWFVAPSDTHSWVQICPYDGSKGTANCWNDANNRLCGRKVKVSCAENCKPGGPKYVVAAVMDYCAQNHPDRKLEEQKGGISRCKAYHAWDVSTHIWELVKSREDNIRINFELLPANSAEGLGPKY